MARVSTLMTALSDMNISLFHSHKNEVQNAQHLRGGIGSGEMQTEEKGMDGSSPRIVGQDDPSRETKEVGYEDRVARNMYDAVRIHENSKSSHLLNYLLIIFPIVLSDHCIPRVPGALFRRLSATHLIRASCS